MLLVRKWPRMGVGFAAMEVPWAPRALRMRQRSPALC